MAMLILAQSYTGRHSAVLTAIATLVTAAIVVALANRWIDRRGMRLAAAFTGGELSRSADTRLRFLRRAVDATVVTIAVAIAFSQFTALDKVGHAVLASGAIAAAVVGFAARQTLANAIAGVFLATTQPLRIGDVVSFEGETGTVEDIRLTSTWLRTGGGSRVIVPNERLAGGVLRNDSIVDGLVAVEASVWLAADRDAVDAADRVRAGLPSTTVRVAETRAEGTRLLVIADPSSPGDRVAREAQLREDALRAIRA